jgi:glycosyltransferase involved in cell wall biosynthesis
MLVSRHRSLYAAFDRFPTRKGAAVHIARFAPALFDHAGSGILYVLGGDGDPLHQLEGNAEIVRHPGGEPNFLERAAGFARRLVSLLDEAAPALEIVHFRDPWSGAPILTHPASFRTVYEVNGLPSIELPYLFPSIAPRTRAKIEAMERFCLERADRIVTPSKTTRDLLVSRGVRQRKITVIPNGADAPALPVRRPSGAPAKYVIYVGALQPWQGTDTLVRAMARLADLDLSLVICASNRSRHSKRIERLAEKLELGPRVVWHHALEPPELIPWLAHALASVAPLRDCDRNAIQGCSPLKVLESMAAGTPVVASDLPPVREIVDDGIDGVLVPADRPAALARAIRILHDYPEHARRIGDAARAKAARSFDWQQSLQLLKKVYDGLGASAPGSPSRDNDVNALMEGP